MKYFIANWKAHKTIYEALDWIKIFTKVLSTDEDLLVKLSQNQIKIIVCPPSLYLYFLKQHIKEFNNVHIGTQDISMFEQGSYTGEVSASMLKPHIEYSIVGHSERRKEFHENETMIESKVKLLNKNAVTSILCVRNQHDSLYQSADLIAFEPVEAIGTGRNMSIQDVIEIKKTLNLQPHQPFIYGGSITAQDCREYKEGDEVDGFLIGKASLDAKEFIQIIKTFTS